MTVSVVWQWRYVANDMKTYLQLFLWIIVIERGKSGEIQCIGRAEVGRGKKEMRSNRGFSAIGKFCKTSM